MKKIFSATVLFVLYLFLGTSVTLAENEDTSYALPGAAIWNSFSQEQKEQVVFGIRTGIYASKGISFGFIDEIYGDSWVTRRCDIGKLQAKERKLCWYSVGMMAGLNAAAVSMVAEKVPLELIIIALDQIYANPKNKNIPLVSAVSFSMLHMSSILSPSEYNEELKRLAKEFPAN